MKQCVLLLLACVCAHGAPLEPGLHAGSCQDASALGAAGLALTEINEDRREGYIFSLHRLSNVNQMEHADTGVVFYLTLDVVETNCHVLSKKKWKTCAVRQLDDMPVYGQCKAVIYINKPQRVVRLYNYNCVVRPVSSAKVHSTCPDCPSAMNKENKEIVKTAALSIEKFNKDHHLANHFALLNITRASASFGMAMFYFVEYTIQETTCANSTDPAQAAKCPPMGCEFAHKGHCKASHSHAHAPDEDGIDVICEIFEPESAEKEKRLHLLGGETDHNHTDTHAHDPKHDQAHDATGHDHDHVHDHTKGHVHNETHAHEDGGDHHHTHANGNSHDHGHDHDHEHTHHAKAHDHSKDVGPHHHHHYAHAGQHTHEHDHELALDHDHKHGHLHEHEHHHHHHDHEHKKSHRHPQGSWKVLAAQDTHDHAHDGTGSHTHDHDHEHGAAGSHAHAHDHDHAPDATGSHTHDHDHAHAEGVQGMNQEQGVTLPLIPDPDIPGQREPTILPFPAAASAQCPVPPVDGEGIKFIKELFAEDPAFKAAV